MRDGGRRGEAHGVTLITSSCHLSVCGTRSWRTLRGRGTVVLLRVHFLVVSCRKDGPRRGGQSGLLSGAGRLHPPAQSLLGEPQPNSRYSLNTDMCHGTIQTHGCDAERRATVTHGCCFSHTRVRQHLKSCDGSLQGDGHVVVVPWQGCARGTIPGHPTARPFTPPRSSSSRKLWPPKPSTSRYLSLTPFPSIPLLSSFLSEPACTPTVVLYSRSRRLSSLHTLSNVLLLRLLRNHPTNGACCHGN